VRAQLALASALASAIVLPASARAENVVNYTFHVPAQVMTNPCAVTDVVNLNGDVHVVITATDDGNRGYHTMNHLNSHLSGRSITSGLRYTNLEEQDDEWYARPPAPSVHTHTYSFDLNSQTGVDNYVVKMTMHETVNATGIPTAVVDRWEMDCRG